ncbi:C-X-C motif chemokine 9 [Hyperolius riggenbachi]|uniref:C-X-C motif chemokine 9 n=1 Tax=Hyperolius riggenbachi TaxID=752182 RepID=UPI0035A3B90D
MKKKLIIAFLCSGLILQCVQALTPLGGHYCLCIDGSTSSVKIQNIMKLEVFPGGPKCEKMEVIATLKNGRKKCLNPSSKVVKSIIPKWSKKYAEGVGK